MAPRLTTLPGPVKEYNEGARKSEARAEIAGFNAVAAQATHDNPRETLADLYKVDGGVSNYMESDEKSRATVKMDAGFHIKPDLQLDQDKSLEAMAKSFYDSNRGYPARNIDWAFGQIYLQEAIAQKANPDRPAPEMMVDVKALGVDIQLPLGFKDSSPTLDQSAPTQRPAAPGANDPGSPDHKLLEKIRDSVRDLEQSIGRPWDARSERMSAAALALAVGSGFGPDDDVRVALNRATTQNAAGEVLFAYRDGRNASPDPAANFAHMPVAQALASPAAEHYQQAQAMRDTQALEQRRAQASAQQTQATEEPAQGGPKMQR